MAPGAPQNRISQPDQGVIPQPNQDVCLCSVLSL
jgi:hypothetical protein